MATKQVHGQGREKLCVMFVVHKKSFDLINLSKLFGILLNAGLYFIFLCTDNIALLFTATTDLRHQIDSLRRIYKNFAAEEKLCTYVNRNTCKSEVANMYTYFR